MRTAKKRTAPSPRTRVAVKQNEKEPVAVEVLATSIVDISKAAKSLLSSRLKFDALVMLISHASKVPQKHVRAVLDGIYSLEETYLKEKE